MADQSRGLVGRSFELGRIGDFLDRLVRDGACTVVSGEVGVGKTVLLQAVVEKATAAGMRVLRTAGIEFEADIAYSGLNQMLLGAYRDLDRLPEPRRQVLAVALGYGSGPAPDRTAVCEATLELLQVLARGCPVLITVDDAQWLDRSSATVLEFVARRLHGHPIGLVAAVRSGNRTLFDRHDLAHYEVPSLDAEASAELLDAYHPGLPTAARERLLAEAEGNPLALIELAEVLRLVTPESSPLPEVLPLSERLHAMFADRIAALPERTRRLLLITAFDRDGDLRVLGSGTDEDLLADLAPAEQARLIAVDVPAARIRFRHPLIRSAIVGESSKQERRSAHRTLADALSSSPERRTWHLAEAADGPDEQVAALLEASAHASMARGDAIGAVSALLRAADLSADASSAAGRLAEAAYLGAETRGEPHRARSLLATARQAAPGTPDPLHAALATVFLLLDEDGDVGTAHRLLVSAIEEGSHGWKATDPALIEAMHNLLLISWQASRPEGWAAFHRALDKVDPAPPPLLALSAYAFPDPVRTGQAALPIAEGILATLDVEQDPSRIIRAGMAMIYLDRLADVREASLRLLTDGDTRGVARRSIGSLVNIGLDDFLTGRWQECERFAQEGLALCRNRNFPFFRWYFHYLLAAVAAGRGDFEQAETLADDITAWASPRGVGAAQIFAEHPRVLCSMGRGDFEAAFQRASAMSPPGTLAEYVPHCLWVAFDLVEAAVRTGRRAAAQAHAAALQTAGITAISPRLAMLVAGANALVADDDAAGALYQQALAMPGAKRYVFELARIRLCYGEWLRRTRALISARDQLLAAHGAFVEMGAAPWARRTADELRAAGQAVTRITNAAVGSLTAQERSVTELAAGGMTNKQIAERLFLSPRTVSAHLSQAYQKLGVTTRAALRDALSRQGSIAEGRARHQA